MKHDVPAALAAPGRTAALRRSGLLDSPPEESFDRLARLVCRLLNAPIALITLVDAERQFFKSCVGLPEPWAARRETPLSHSFCRHTVETGAPLIIDDARGHALVRDNPAIEEMGVVAYAGIPLVDPEGEVLGSFCVIDHQPRHWTDEQVAVLTDLAASVQTEIRLREAVADSMRRAAETDRIRLQDETLIEGVDAILWESDTVNGFTFVSRHAEAMLGYPVERWLAEPRFWSEELLHPEDRQQALDLCFTATAEGRDHDFEYRAIRADGETVWLRELVRVEPGVDGAATRLRGLIVDVTEEKRAEQALQKREAQFTEAQAVAHIGSWEMDIASDAVFWSDELYRLFGLEPQTVALTAEGFFGMVHPDDRDRVRRAVEGTIRGEGPYDVEGRVVHPDGSIRYLQMRGEAVLDRHGNALRLRGTGQDISDRIRAELALRASEESYRTLFDLAGDALFVHDPESGAVLDANRYGCEMHGVSLEELKRNGLEVIGEPVAPFTGADALEYIRRAGAGEPQRFEWQATGPDGGPRWQEVSLHQVTILGERRVLANVRDIHERKAAEAALLSAEENAQAVASRMRAVANAAAGVIGAESVDELQQVLRTECRAVISFDAFTMALYDGAAHTLSYLEGYDADIAVSARTVAIEGTPGERVIRSRRSLLTRGSDDPAAAGSRPIGTGRR
jgi:PAS domain S-box-containing protein